jgi:hypothetical protein
MQVLLGEEQDLLADEQDSSSCSWSANPELTPAVLITNNRWFGDRSANVTTKGSNTHHVEVYNPKFS